MTFKYDYVTDLKPGENQYDSTYDLNSEKIVDARYIPSNSLPGNPFFEALPKPWSFREVACNYNRPVNVPSTEELMEMDEYEREDNVDLLLDSFRVQLPFHAMLEKQFHRALLRTYEKRQFMEDRGADVTLTMHDANVTTHNKMVIRNLSDGAPGFTLLGESGCGKTTGINMMLSHYPQVIIHLKDTWHRTVQIVYLHVHCVHNSNFVQLYSNIGAAIDRALGNFNPVYEAEFDSVKSLGGKYRLLKRLVEKFAIGCLILDEIEFINPKATTENSLETFLTLSNETGIAVCAVGTLDAYKRLFMKARTARRMGTSIIASRYCGDRKRFGSVVKILTVNQWGAPVDYNEELVNALFQASHGVISDLIEIYKLIQKDRLKALPLPDTDIMTPKTIDITPEYIRKKGEEYFKILNEARTLEENPVSSGNAKMIADEITRLSTAAELTEQNQMEKRYDEVMGDPSYRKYIDLKEQAITAVMAVDHQFSRNAVEKVFGIVVKKENLDVDPDTAAAKILAYLRKRSEKKSRKSDTGAESQRVVNAAEMQKELLENQNSVSAS